MWKYIFRLRCERLDEKHLAACVESWEKTLSQKQDNNKNDIDDVLRKKNGRWAKVEHRQVKSGVHEARIELSSPAQTADVARHFFSGPPEDPPTVIASHSPSLIPPHF